MTLNYFIPISQALERTIPARQHLPTSLITGFTTLIIINLKGSCLFTLEKAFDVISSDLLLRKLPIYELSSSTLAFLSSYLADRHQCVYVHSRRSMLLRLQHGVPQGSVLGPLLFSIYVNGVPLYLRALCELFADDTTIQTNNTDLNKVHDTLQYSIHELVKWTELNYMSPPPKTQMHACQSLRDKRGKI